MRTIWNVMTAASLAGSLFAQQPPVRTRLQVGGPAFEYHAFQEGGLNSTVAFVHDMNLGPIVKNAPYSAEAVTETVQQLYDGNRIVQSQTAKLYRDKQGRERREESSPMDTVFISDPIAGESYTLLPDSKSAEKHPYGANSPVVFSKTAQISRRADTNGVMVSTTTAPLAGVSPQIFLVQKGGDKLGEPKEESLGKRTIEGVEATGTRTTTTIPAGAIGNDRAIDIVDERWFSPDLQMTVMTRHADPRSGETTYKLTNIQRVEQVPTLFEIPPDYTVNQGGKGFFRVGPSLERAPSTNQ